MTTNGCTRRKRLATTRHEYMVSLGMAVAFDICIRYPLLFCSLSRSWSSITISPIQVQADLQLLSVSRYLHLLLHPFLQTCPSGLPKDSSVSAFSLQSISLQYQSKIHPTYRPTPSADSGSAASVFAKDRCFLFEPQVVVDSES